MTNLYLDKGAYFIRLPYLVYLFFIITLFITTLYFLSNADNFSDFKFFSYFNTIKFTFFQAFLACSISSIAGFIFGLILYLSNKNPKVISSLLNFCFILPVIFVSFGSIFFYSSNGILSVIFHWLSVDYNVNVFSLKGIIYVTSYFNIAFNANFFYRKLINIPENYIKVLQSNGIPFLKSIKLQLKNFIFSGYSSVLILSFIFCIGNFTIVYILSGSPNLTTIELAIYQSIIFDADLMKAILLGMTQLIIIMVISLSLISKTNTFSTFASFKKSYHIIDKPIFIDYFFWIIMWTLIGRVAMNIFQREDSQFFFMRVFVKYTNPLIRLFKPITPSFIIGPLVPLYVAWFFYMIRFYLMPWILGYSVMGMLSFPLESEISRQIYQFFDSIKF